MKLNMLGLDIGNSSPAKNMESCARIKVKYYRVALWHIFYDILFRVPVAFLSVMGIREQYSAPKFTVKRNLKCK